MRQRQQGFTIVELLVVVVIIGILAAMTVVTYNNVRSRAIGAELSSDLRNAKQQLEMTKAETGQYPESTSEANGGKGLLAAEGTTYQYTVDTQAGTFCLTAVSNKTAYNISNGSMAIAGTCPGHTISGTSDGPIAEGAVQAASFRYRVMSNLPRVISVS